LKKQQKETTLAFMTDVQKLSAPEAYRPFIDQIDGILKKYKEYASAVGDTANAQDSLQKAQAEMSRQNSIVQVMGSSYKYTYDYTQAIKNLTDAQNGLTTAVTTQATAQDYLNASLKDYLTQETRQLADEREKAVKDSIQLIDLQKQRNDLNMQFAQSEYDILARGSLTRQMTTAQTKMLELDKLKKEHDLRMQDINSQIQVEQFRVDNERQIFDLSTTRVGLETKLVGLQKDQVTRDTKRIEALSTLVDKLNTGNMADLLPLLQFLGYSTSQLPPTLQQQFQQSYNNAARQGIGGFH